MINNARVWLGSKGESQMSRIGLNRLAVIIHSDIGMCGSIGGTNKLSNTGRSYKSSLISKIGEYHVSVLGDLKSNKTASFISSVEMIWEVYHD